MPLKGLALDQPTYTEYINFVDIPHHILPPELITALSRDRSPGIHLTDLTACPIKTAKDKLYDYYLPLRALYRIVKGQAMDHLCDVNRRENTIYQQVYRCMLGGVEVSGTPDLIDLAQGRIEDYKCPSRMYSIIPENYVTQLNGYRWLSHIELSPTKINTLRINACGPVTFTYFDVPVWRYDATEEILKARLGNLMDAMDNVNVESTCTNPACIYCKSRTHYVT